MIVHEYLRITWASGKHFLHGFTPDVGQYTVTLPRGADLPPGLAEGGTLPVELEFLDTQQRFRHQSVVIRRARSSQGETLVLGFVPAEQHIKALVTCAADGEKLPYLHRRSERVAVWLPVLARSGGEWIHGIAADLSELGAFLSFLGPPARGTKLLIRAEVDSSRYLELAGRVVHVSEAGCGVEFIFDDRNHEVRVRAAIRSALQKISR